MGISNNVIGKAAEGQKRERSRRGAEELAWEGNAIMVRARERLKRAIKGYAKNDGGEMGKIRS